MLLLQENANGRGHVMFSLAHELTRNARSAFWEDVVAYLYELNAVSPKHALAGDAAASPLLFLTVHDDVALDEVDIWNDPRIWEDFESVELAVYNSGDEPEKPTTARLGVLGEHLVAAYHCHEPEPAGVVTQMTSRDEFIWQDDAVELLVVSGTDNSTHQWIVSAAGVFTDIKDQNDHWQSEVFVDVQRESNAWRAVIAVPLDQLFEDGRVPATFAANLARHEQRVPEISSWITPVQALNTRHSTGTVTRLSPRELASRLLAGRDTESARAESFKLWQVSPWTDELGPNSDSSDVEAWNEQAAAPSLELHVPEGGNDAAVLLVRNEGRDPLVFKVNALRELTAANGEAVAFYDIATLYRGVYNLTSHETLWFDALDELGNAAVLQVPANETAMLWLDMVGHDSPGHYTGQLELVPITTREAKPIRVPVHLHSYDVAFPNPQPLDVYTWGPYLHKTFGEPARYLELASSAHINHFRLTFNSSTNAIHDGPVIDDELTAYLGGEDTFIEHGQIVYSYGLFEQFHRKLEAAGFDGEMMDDQWQSLFLEWFENWMAALAEVGIAYDDFWIQVIDEPRSHEVPELVEQLSFFNEHFPEVRTAVTIAQWGEWSEIQALRPFIDLWIPEQRRLTTHETAEREHDLYMDEDYLFWPYRCRIQMQVQSMIGYYRKRGIEDYLLGADGMALWAFNSWRAEPWTQWDRRSSGPDVQHDNALVHRGEFGPVPTKRLFAFRQGIEDYMLMHLLQETMKQNVSAEHTRQIESLHQEAEELLQVNNPEAFDDWRERVLALLGQTGK